MMFFERIFWSKKRVQYTGKVKDAQAITTKTNTFTF
jgi:hypothetical protein